MAATDLTSFQYATKVVFPKGIAFHTYEDKNAPFMMLVDKDPKGRGRHLAVSVEYGSVNGRSVDIDKARANAAGTKGAEFQLPWRKDYAAFSVDRLTMNAAEGEGAIIEAWTRQLKHAKNRMQRSLAHSLTGDGSGAIGQVSAVAGGVVTFTAKAATVLLEVGDTVIANPNKTGNSGTIRAGTGTITKVQRQNGKFNYTANGGFTPQVNDYIYIEGDYDGRMSGVQAWLPYDEPSSTAWNNVDRSLDSVRLAGIRVDQSGAGGILDALLGGMEPFRNEGASPSHIFVSQAVYMLAEKEAETRRIRTAEVPTEYGVGVKGLEIGGAVLLGDMYFPDGYAYPLTLEDWTFTSVDEAPHIIMDDGLDKRRATTGDAFSGEMASYGNLKCEEPGRSGVIKLPSIG